VSALEQLVAQEKGDGVEGPWGPIAVVRPQLAATADRYLTQLSVSLRPASVTVAGIALRQFCIHLIETHPEVRCFSDVKRPHAESFKAELAERRIFDDKGLKPNTVRLRLLCLRTFFDRIIEWGWPEAPDRPPLFLTDVPPKDEPLPRALDDAAAARFMKAAAAEEDPRRQLVVELLARTGMRVGELCGLQGDAVENRGGQWWLRIPLGKLHTDRYVPLHPRLVELLTAWRKQHDDGGTGLLVTNDGRALNRHVVTRMVRRVARAAGIGHVHPHQLRHTLATQAINRGMRLEAISQMLGHRSLEMTAVYARIADRTVANEYRAVSERVEALYAAEPSTETVPMQRLRREHRRLLGNGWCTRPKEMDCSFESVCEGCGFFATTVEFKPTLTRQRDDAIAHDLPQRAAVFDELLEGLADEAS
jgi:integrase